MTAGYSKRTLAQKLGIKPGVKVVALNAPDSYESLLGELDEGVQLSRNMEERGGQADIVHYFADSGVELDHDFPELKSAIKQNGALWVSWLKGSARSSSNLNENIIREIGLKHGLVDVKVIAVDAVWSGLKFVYRLKDRG